MVLAIRCCDRFFPFFPLPPFFSSSGCHVDAKNFSATLPAMFELPVNLTDGWVGGVPVHVPIGMRGTMPSTSFWPGFFARPHEHRCHTTTHSSTHPPPIHPPFHPPFHPPTCGLPYAARCFTLIGLFTFDGCVSKMGLQVSCRRPPGPSRRAGPPGRSAKIVATCKVRQLRHHILPISRAFLSPMSPHTRRGTSPLGAFLGGGHYSSAVADCVLAIS